MATRKPKGLSRVLDMLAKPERYLMATHRRDSVSFDIMPDLIPVRADIARLLTEPGECNNPTQWDYQIVPGNDGLFENTPQTWRVQ